MSPSRVDDPLPSFGQKSTTGEPYKGPPRNITTINDINFDDSLQPTTYNILGIHPDSKTLFEDVSILDSTGRDPYPGDVLIEGEKIVKSEGDHGRGRTLMSGLGEAHTHFTWNGGDLNRLGDLGVEEHVLLTARSAQCYIDSGYTMCFGAASAKDRLDVVIRDVINAGDIPAYADGPEEMREVIRHHVKLGVDNIKLSMSGEEITETRSAQVCYFTDEETAACVDEGHKLGKRLCAHARARDWGMDMLEAKKTKHVVAPAINWLIGTLNDAEAFGYPKAKAEQVGYKKELDAAIRGLREMHRRGIPILPGGDYGFAWTPHGTYARDLEHFVKLLDFTPMESIIAATAGVAKLFMREKELGKIQEGFYADCILVDGDPLEDITVLQDHDKLNVIVLNGRVHKAGRKEYIAPPVA
ncbi:hypothetical protein LOCC1_G006070 [Lachnellula occidentalis]|uniref:Amidohydrolase-related domain-containing protein n=1 Tax=Lachnellula occidentalis TaxID=215460 RepID=A0A8H8RMH6_9HELO|nr:hypothetical protein LOCC1_G006070 [Lachnellula occidentalis]